MKPGAIIFDFDGVLLESEFASNLHLSELLSELGYPTSVDHALTHFTGLSGTAFLEAIERHAGEALPSSFHARRKLEDQRALRDGLDEVAGATRFVRSLPDALPKAIASSSTTHWIRTHLDHLGLGTVFGDHIYSGHEHVRRGKPAPDIYLYAAERLGVEIGRCVIIEDSEVGATGAVATGARVIGLVAGRHCSAGHGDRLRAIGVEAIAEDFQQVTGLLELE